MACLIVDSSPTEQGGKHFAVRKRTLAGGRDPAREIQILDPTVSRKHFLIRHENDGHIIVDTKTKNGIYVNDKQVEEARLADGDRIRVGDTTLIYYVADHSDRTDALNVQRRADRQLREDQTQMPGKR